MGVATDKTIKDLRNAVNGIDTSNLLSDATGLSIKNAIDGITNALTIANTLVGLSDVNITSPTNGQVLVYNATTQKWENGNSSGGGGSMSRLCYNQNGFQASTTITLNEDINNYDLLQINCIYSSTTCLLGSILPVEVFKTCTDRYYIGYFPSIYADIKYVSNTTIETIRTNQAFLQSIYGIKL